MKQILLFILGILFLINLIPATSVGISEMTEDRVVYIPPEVIINYSLIPTVNSSAFWDSLDDSTDIDYSDFGAGFWDSNVDLGIYNLTANWFKGKFNWTSADDWNIFDGSILDFNESKLSTVYYNATQSGAIAGTIDGGTLEDTQHPDGNYDGVTFNFSEDSGSPGLDLRMNFTGIESFNRGVMRYKTNDLKGDFPIVQLWSYTDSDWEDYPSVSKSESFATMTQPVFDDTEHVGTGANAGVVQMRIYKSSIGNTQNHYYIDWVAISKGYGTPSGTELDPFFEAWLNNPVLENNLNMSDYNATFNFLNVSGGLYGIFDDYAKYQFSNNNFNGSGDINTTGTVKVKILEIDNQGPGDNPTWYASFPSAQMRTESNLHTNKLLSFSANTAYLGQIGATLTGNRIWEFPDITGHIAITPTYQNITGEILFTPTDQDFITTGDLGLGILDPKGRIDVRGTTLTDSSMYFTRYSDNAYTPAIYFRKSRGSVSPEHEAVEDGDFIGTYFFKGSDGTNWKEVARIDITVDGTVSAGVVPGKIRLWTTSLTGVTTERMSIGTSGNVFIGGSGDATHKLEVEYDSGGASSEVAMFDGGGSDGDESKIIIGAVSSNNNAAVLGYHHDFTSSDIYGYLETYGGTRAITWDKDGNVGINTSTITYPLEVNADVSDISIWASKNISATGFITRTSIFDNSKDPFDYIKDSVDYLDKGKIDHKKFYGYAGEFEVTDYSKPIEKEILINETIPENYTYVETNCSYEKRTSDGYNYVCENIIKQGIRNKQVCHNEIRYEFVFNEEKSYYERIESEIKICEDVMQEVSKVEITYPNKKIESGIELGAEINVLRQAVYELNERIKVLEK